jgi:peptide/nickel transport system substrate-binding protein
VAAPAPGAWSAGDQRVDELVLRWVGDDRARVEAVLAGEADVAAARGVGVGPALEAARVGAARLVSFPDTVSLALQLNRDSPALGDARVRRALGMAVDRRTLVDGVLQGRATPAVQTLPAGQPGHEPDLERDPHDPAAARRLLDDAGVGELELTGLQLVEAQTATTPLDVVRDQLAAVGVHVRITSLPPAELIPTWQAGGADVRIVLAPLLPHPALTLHRRLNPTQNPGDLSRMSGRLPALAARLLDQRLSPDEAAALHREVNRQILEDAVIVELARVHTDVLAGNHVVGLEDVPNVILNMIDVRHLAVGPPR